MTFCVRDSDDNIVCVDAEIDHLTEEDGDLFQKSSWPHIVIDEVWPEIYDTKNIREQIMKLILKNK